MKVCSRLLSLEVVIFVKNAKFGILTPPLLYGDLGATYDHG